MLSWRPPSDEGSYWNAKFSIRVYLFLPYYGPDSGRTPFPLLIFYFIFFLYKFLPSPFFLTPHITNNSTLASLTLPAPPLIFFFFFSFQFEIWKLFCCVLYPLMRGLGEINSWSKRRIGCYDGKSRLFATARRRVSAVSGFSSRDSTSVDNHFQLERRLFLLLPLG